jgi:hypothetical protein
LELLGRLHVLDDIEKLQDVPVLDAQKLVGAKLWQVVARGSAQAKARRKAGFHGEVPQQHCRFLLKRNVRETKAAAAQPTQAIVSTDARDIWLAAAPAPFACYHSGISKTLK